MSVTDFTGAQVKGCKNHDPLDSAMFRLALKRTSEKNK